jgi:hypothetical protein
VTLINARQRAKRIIARNKRLGDLLGGEVPPGYVYFDGKPLSPELFAIVEKVRAYFLKGLTQYYSEGRTAENVRERAKAILSEMPEELKELCDELSESGTD